MKKLPRMRVIFVAGLDPPSSGARGGQVTEASNLAHSELFRKVELIPVNSTMATVPPPPVMARAIAALGRVLLFAAALKNADVVLIFSADGLSLVEKTLMVWMARLAGRGVLLRIGSGFVVPQCERSRLMRWTLMAALRGCHVLCSQGTYWNHYFGQWSWARNKIVNIPNPVPRAYQRARPRAEDAAPRLFYCGWLVRKKGIFDLLPMMRSVVEKYPNAILTLAGGGADREQFIADVESAGLQASVRTLGWITPREVMAELGKTDVFVFPSYFEGMPNALLEAMAVGVPVVATEVGAVRDVVIPRVTGILVQPGNAKEITAGVLELLSSAGKAADLGAAGRSLIREKFDVEVVCLMYAKALTRAAYEAGRHPVVFLGDLARHSQEVSASCAAS